MNEPTISEILAALTRGEIKATMTDALPSAFLVIFLSVIFSLLTYPVSAILAGFNRSFGFPVIPDWVYTALFLGIVLWIVRAQSVHLPILGVLAWLVLLMMVTLPIVVSFYLPGWAILPAILTILTPLYLFAKLLESGRKKLEAGDA